MSEQGRWTKQPAGQGDDPEDIDVEMHDPDRVEHLAENRPVTNDQTPTGEQGTTADRPGVDGGGYPEETPRPPSGTAGAETDH
jgi:hypothetical protein